MDNSLQGPFAESIAEHVALKQAMGYKYVTELNSLSRFAKFTERKYPNAKGLTREIVLDWCEKKSYESPATQCLRASILRQLAIYMDRVGLDAYILPKGYHPTEEKYVPHIFTEDERFDPRIMENSCLMLQIPHDCRYIKQPSLAV